MRCCHKVSNIMQYNVIEVGHYVFAYFSVLSCTMLHLMYSSCLMSPLMSSSQMCDLFDKVIDFNHNPTSESAKRKLDVVS